MGLKVEGHVLIPNVHSLSLVHLYAISADWDEIETQDGIFRIFRKKMTSETAWLQVVTWKS